MSAMPADEAPQQRMLARLLAARERYGREAMRRIEHAFLHYARLRPPLRADHPLRRPTWLLPGVPDHGPFPTPGLLPALATLESAAADIRCEALAALQDTAQTVSYEDGTPHSGRWSALHLRYGGRSVESGLRAMPRTSALLAGLPHIGEMAMLSVLAAGSHIQPHCGLHNYRWTAHLGLRVPEGCWFRVSEETRAWQSGRCLLFDDSYEHEARNTGSEDRLLLLVDFWHPALRPEEVAVLSEIAADLAALRRLPGTSALDGKTAAA